MLSRFNAKAQIIEDAGANGILVNNTGHSRKLLEYIRVCEKCTASLLIASLR